MSDDEKKNKITRQTMELGVAPVEEALSLDASYSKVPLGSSPVRARGLLLLWGHW
jgi:hypothetical protein